MTAQTIPQIRYAFTISPVDDAAGGGYLIEFPGFPGCVSDGASIEEAIRNGAGKLALLLSAPVTPPVPESAAGSASPAL